MAIKSSAMIIQKGQVGRRDTDFDGKLNALVHPAHGNALDPRYVRCVEFLVVVTLLSD